MIQKPASICVLTPARLISRKNSMLEKTSQPEKSNLEQLRRFNEIEPRVFDIREIKTTLELDALLLSLMKDEHVLLHGTASRIDASLEPRQANDLSRESGSRRAVYATNLPERAIFHAIMNKPYLFEKLKSFTTGYENNESGVLEFGFTKNVKDLIDAGDQDVFCDGYIHALRDETFKKSEGDDSEYQSTERSKPLFSLLISRDLGEDVKKRSRVYNPEELK